MTLIEKLEKLSDEYLNLYMDYGDNADLNCSSAVDEAINIVKEHSDWIDISVEPNNRTEFDSEAVLAIDVNGYTYNVTLANVVIRGETKREWTECKAKWNGEFWEAVEYICQAEKLVAYKHIPQPPSEVQDGKTDD